MTTLDRTEQLDLLVNGLGARRLPEQSSLQTIEVLGQRIVEVLNNISDDLEEHDYDLGADVHCPHRDRVHRGSFMGLDIHFCNRCWLALRYRAADYSDWEQLRVLIAG